MERAQKVGFRVYKGRSIVKVENSLKCMFGWGGLKKCEAEMVGMLDKSSDRGSDNFRDCVFGKQNRAPLAE